MLDENRVEGLVHVSNLGDDYYTLDQTGTMLTGARGAGHFRVGDRVRVRVARVDRERREVDFELLEAEGRVIRPAAGTRRGSRATKAKHHWESQESARKVRAERERAGARKARSSGRKEGSDGGRGRKTPGKGEAVSGQIESRPARSGKAGPRKRRPTRSRPVKRRSGGTRPGKGVPRKTTKGARSGRPRKTGR
jgi:ribonuclease R